MTVNLNFMALMIFLLVLALMYPIICSVLITVLLINQFRKLKKKNETLFDPELAKQECIGVFYKFIIAMCEQKNELQEKICLTKYKLERVPVKIFEAEVESSSFEQMKIKFALLSTSGEILINRVTFIKNDNQWIIKEIQ